MSDKKWRRVENEWNLQTAPWSGGFGIEEIDEDLAVPSLVCWFYRGWDESLVDRVVEMHNRWVDERADAD